MDLSVHENSLDKDKGTEPLAVLSESNDLKLFCMAEINEKSSLLALRPISRESVDDLGLCLDSPPRSDLLSYPAQSHLRYLVLKDPAHKW